MSKGTRARPGVGSMRGIGGGGATRCVHLGMRYVCCPQVAHNVGTTEGTMRARHGVEPSKAATRLRRRACLALAFPRLCHGLPACVWRAFRGARNSIRQCIQEIGCVAL